jgi:GT2 family glycosyltransferase
MNDLQWPKVFFIILNWNGWKDTLECLESVYGISYPNYEVIIVDNDSRDDSLAKIRAFSQRAIADELPPVQSSCGARHLVVLEYTREETESLSETALAQKKGGLPTRIAGEELIVIKNERNFGYAEGNNIGIRFALKAGADYVLLLNNDTTVDKNFLTELVLVSENDSTIGAIGPKIYFYDHRDVIQTTGAHINFWTGGAIALNWEKTDDALDHPGTQGLLSVDYIYGACFLISRKVIQEVGGLDPLYFLYGEELDWCIRINRAGYRILCDLNSKIWHKGMASTSKSKRFSQYYLERNRVIYMRKYARTLQFLSFLLYYPPYNVAFLVKKRQFGDIPHFFKGFVAGLFIHLNASS